MCKLSLVTNVNKQKKKKKTERSTFFLKNSSCFCGLKLRQRHTGTAVPGKGTGGLQKIEKNILFWQRTYRIYSIKRPGRLLNFGTSRVGTYSRWALIQFSQFSSSSKSFLHPKIKK